MHNYWTPKLSEAELKLPGLFALFEGEHVAAGGGEGGPEMGIIGGLYGKRSDVVLCRLDGRRSSATVSGHRSRAISKSPWLRISASATFNLKQPI
jgi:hypothetical protein